MADLVIKISGDIKNYNTALEQAKNQTADLSSSMSAIAQGATLAFAALTAEIGFATSAFKESQQVVNQLEQALKNQGLVSKNLSLAYQDQATKLQNLTGVSDEAILRSQTILQSFLGQQIVTEELTQSVLDFSAAKQIDAETSANIFGKAIEGNVGVLKRYGIEIDENLPRQERLAQITEKVSEKFGGQAEAAAKGLGSLNILKEAFGDLQEKIGERFAPAIEFAANKLTDFFNAFANNPSLVTFTTSLLAGGVALTGMIALIAAGTVAFIAFSAAATAANVSLGAFLLPLAILAAGVTAAAVAFGYFATKQKDVQTSSEITGEKIKELREDLEKLQGQGNRGSDGKYFKRVQDEIDAKSAQLKRLEELQEKQAEGEMRRENGKNTALNEEAKKAANAREAEENRKDQVRIQASRLKNEILRLENQNASDEYIKLKQDELAVLNQIESEDSDTTRKLLEQKLAEKKELSAQYLADKKETEAQFNAEIYQQNQDFQDLTDEQQAQFKEKNDANLRAGYLTKNQAEQQAALDSAKIQQKSHNDFLIAQAKFGTAYATINQIMNSAIVQGSAKAFGELAALQTSSNATLKSIGKIAAIANITIKTAESAMNIYAGFSTIPIVGPILGTIGAAAAVAFGIENISKVQGAAEGGLMTGGIPGVDSIPVMAQQGELIAPKQNFDEVVNAVADSRASERAGTGAGAGPSGPIEIMLSFKDDAIRYIEAQLIEGEKLGTSLRGTT